MLLLDDEDELPSEPEASELQFAADVGRAGLLAIDEALRQHTKAAGSRS